MPCYRPGTLRVAIVDLNCHLVLGTHVLVFEAVELETLQAAPASVNRACPTSESTPKVSGSFRWKTPTATGSASSAGRRKRIDPRTEASASISMPGELW